MKIIAGTAKGRTITSPSGKVRPLRAQVREALFNILSYPEERIILDLFAGTGAVGLEAVSRGFSFATFVELSGKNCKLISNNIHQLGLERDSFRIIRDNVFYFLNAAKNEDAGFDVIFCGTPYIDDVIQELYQRLDDLIDILNPDGVLIIQSPSECKIAIPEILSPRKYGSDTLLFYYK